MPMNARRSILFITFLMFLFVDPPKTKLREELGRIKAGISPEQRFLCRHMCMMPTTHRNKACMLTGRFMLHIPPRNASCTCGNEHNPEGHPPHDYIRHVTYGFTNITHLLYYEYEMFPLEQMMTRVYRNTIQYHATVAE